MQIIQPSLEVLELTSQQTGSLLVAVNTLCSASSGKEGLIRELSELEGNIRSSQDSQEGLLRRIRMEDSQLEDCKIRADGMNKVEIEHLITFISFPILSFRWYEL